MDIVFEPAGRVQNENRKILMISLGKHWLNALFFSPGPGLRIGKDTTPPTKYMKVKLPVHVNVTSLVHEEKDVETMQDPHVLQLLSDVEITIYNKILFFYGTSLLLCRILLVSATGVCTVPVPLYHPAGRVPGTCTADLSTDLTGYPGSYY